MHFIFKETWTGGGGGGGENQSSQSLLNVRKAIASYEAECILPSSLQYKSWSSGSKSISSI